MARDLPHILLVNPWIHDFAAYDFWAKPMGLLYIAALLRHHDVTVSYIDCLDRFHPRAPKSNPYARYGRGPYLKTRITKPAVLYDVPRHFSRYGIKPSWFKEDLLKQVPPDLILVTSLMTYWYPGVQETIQIIKAAFPSTPVVLGGIYARLCQDHAQKYSGAVQVSIDRAEQTLFSIVERHVGYSIQPKFNSSDLDSYPFPALDLQSKINYAPILTSRGCPFNCAYCVSGFLEPKRLQRSPESVLEEIKFWQKSFEIHDFVLYDDAFLVNAESHAIPIMKKICKSNLRIRIHTPNAVHIRRIDKETADLMLQAGFTTLRLGLETAEFDHRTEFDKKVSDEDFNRAIICLKEAGFRKDQIGAYLLVGLPEQSWKSIEQSIRTVRRHGITPILAYYTPIPHTALWPKAVASSRYDLESDPMVTNNAIVPCRKEPFSWEQISYLKKMAAD
ncbi:MAG: radical SAM protein [Desulfobacterales bacterium]